MTYVLYKVGKVADANATESLTRIMSNEDINALREDANHFFALPDNLIGRQDEQLYIDAGAMRSNTVITAAGDKQYHRHIEIREIGKGRSQ